MAVVLRSGFIDDLRSRVHRNHLNNSSLLGVPHDLEAQLDRLIAELRTHRPDLPSRDRLLSFVLSRLCLDSIVREAAEPASSDWRVSRHDASFDVENVIAGRRARRMSCS
jgi:hypothetical protein